MRRFTIFIDDDLAHDFDRLIAQRGYVNRSEAVRDLIRERLGIAMLDTTKAQWCVATVSYVYDHHEHALTSRLMDLQHAHHDLVVGSLRTPLDHNDCLEIVVLKGPAGAVQACAGQITALRGVRHGQIHSLALAEDGHSHRHAPAPSQRQAHRHFTPVV